MDFKKIGKLGAAACSLLLALFYFLYTVAYFIGYHNAKNTAKVSAPVRSLGFFFDILFQNEWLIWLTLALCLAIIFFGGRDLYDLAALQRSFLFDALTLLFVTVGLLALSAQFFLSPHEE